MNRTWLFLILPALFLMSCGGNQENSNEEQSVEQEADAPVVEVTGYATIEEITASFLEAVSAKDYDRYLEHVLNDNMEEELSSMIRDESRREDFLKEFGFSLKNEEESFNDLIKYLEEKEIDLSNINSESIESVDYEHEHYAPLEIKEVFIVYSEMSPPIVFTAVKYGDSWVMTSEISL